MLGRAKRVAVGSTGPRASLSQRWEDGEHNGTILWQELQAKGYRGSQRSVYRRLAQWRQQARQSALPVSAGAVPAGSPFDEVTPSQLIGWILARPEKLTGQAQEQLDRLCLLDAQLGQARELAQGFLELIRHHNGEGLESWLKAASASALRPFRSFAHSLQQDHAALVAGLTLTYSTGPVEGQINRLKLIKRQAYGRAGLPYLHLRFLPAA